MKKVFFGILSLLMISFGMLGCSHSANELASKNVSEKVTTYFCGVSGNFKASISSGQRENPYTYNGIKNPLVDFAVLTISCDSNLTYIDVDVKINDDTSTQRLEIDTVTGEYIVDLERYLVGSDLVSVKYKGIELNLECKSKDFKISHIEALKIGNDCFSEDLQNLISKNELLAEIYLRVLSSSADNFSRMYWYYYIFAQNGTTYSCVIDTNSGEIVVKN